MITELRKLANELRQEAAELDTDPCTAETCYGHDAEDEINNELADARREIAARIELVLKRSMLDTAERIGGLEGIGLMDVGIYGYASETAIELKAPAWVTLKLPEHLAQAQRLRDFLIVALLPHEHDTGL